MKNRSPIRRAGAAKAPRKSKPAPDRTRSGTRGQTRRVARASGGVAEIPPSPAALERLLAIPLLDGDEAALERIPGRTVMDSWQTGPAIGLRDVTDGQVRRLRLAAGRFQLELLAERSGQRWKFVARVRQGERVVHRCVLKVARRRLLAEGGGYFHWSSTSVPVSLAVMLAGRQLVFERIPWP